MGFLQKTQGAVPAAVDQAGRHVLKDVRPFCSDALPSVISERVSLSCLRHLDHALRISKNTADGRNKVALIFLRCRITLEANTCFAVLNGFVERCPGTRYDHTSGCLGLDGRNA